MINMKILGVLGAVLLGLLTLFGAGTLFLPDELKSSIDKKRFVASRVKAFNSLQGNALTFGDYSFTQSDDSGIITIQGTIEISEDLYLINQTVSDFQKYSHEGILYVANDIVSDPKNIFSHVISDFYQKQATFLSKGSKYQFVLDFDPASDNVPYFDNQSIESKDWVLVLTYIPKSQLCGATGNHPRLGICDAQQNDAVNLDKSHSSLQRYAFKVLNRYGGV